MTMYNVIIFKNGEAMNTLTVLLENTQAELKSVSVEHGLSLLLRIDDKSFLFDTGATGIFTDNARLMNVRLDDVDCVVISHSHYDHAGGFASFAEKYRVRELVTGSDFFLPKYNFLNGAFTYLGASFDKTFLSSRGIAHRKCDGCLQLSDSLYAFSGFARSYEFETIPERFVKGAVGNTVTDLLASGHTQYDGSGRRSLRQTRIRRLRRVSFGRSRRRTHPQNDRRTAKKRSTKNRFLSLQRKARPRNHRRDKRRNRLPSCDRQRRRTLITGIIKIIKPYRI